MKEQRIDISRPINVEHAPLVIRAVVDGKMTLTDAGPIEGQPAIEEYVLFSVLPEELKQRVKLAIQHILRGG